MSAACDDITSVKKIKLYPEVAENPTFDYITYNDDK